MSCEKEGVKLENEQVDLKVGQDESIVQFKIKKHTPFRKLMTTYCDRAAYCSVFIGLYGNECLISGGLESMNIQNICFRFNGQPVSETDTPVDLEVEDEDTTDIFQQQDGWTVTVFCIC